MANKTVYSSRIKRPKVLYSCPKCGEGGLQANGRARHDRPIVYCYACRSYSVIGEHRPSGRPREREHVECPFCGSKKTRGNGKMYSTKVIKQRYKCDDCKRSWSVAL